ncbi:MAG: ABC transporter permease [Rhodospirillaceae bacterium TMED8]|nr:ABC transporter permease [Magnetovibrio sp.]OUT52260.1 MAG: ABC transporter permease [Rhodospirillaceae bacterium TMED8]|tara:strand:+ start:4688 stop:5590 length:903 start_codon:yes stop_codon:yes gene_type:complete
MTATSKIQVESDFEELEKKKHWFRVSLNMCRKQPLGVAGGIVVLLMIIMAVFAEFLAFYDPEVNSLEHMLLPPDEKYWLGTDQFGRDLLTRIIYGARTALFVGFTCAILGAGFGLVLGVASAYFGGWFDLVVQRIVDVVMAFPLIILALAVVATLGPGTENVILAITIPFIPQCARVVRSNALAIREIPYVDAARALGYSDSRIILRHMVPNVMAPFLIMLTSFLGQAILLEASLSFLGMGVQEPTPAWGLMLQGGAEEFAESAPWVAIWPGVAISLAVFGFNLFGDSVRDTLDPKLRSR